MRLLASAITLVTLLGFALAQPPRKEEEDPKAKPGKVPDITSFPKDKGKTKPPIRPIDGPAAPLKPGVLVVGVRSLPDRMSPTQARTDADRWACDLLFEGLMRPAATEAGTSFEHSLAGASPTAELMGRSFVIDPNAKWSDGSPVQANDVITTIEKMRATGRGELIGESFSDSPRRIRLTLKFPHPDPAAVFAFPIMPANRADEEAFAHQPVGSTPFTYNGNESFGERKYAVFVQGKTRNKPLIEEVRFLAGSDPLNDLKNNWVDVIVEPRTRVLAASTPGSAPGADVAARLDAGNESRVATSPSRRIIYLAFNSLKLALGSDVGRPLRRAIAFGINREEILDAEWRVPGPKLHRALTGPFPAGTWPCDPDAPSLDDRSLAQNELRGNKPPEKPLTLVYPSDDPLAEPSCERIAKQLTNLGMTTESRGLSPVEFRRAVAGKDFDLAYQYFDFRDAWFDPQELFNANDPGGSNRLGPALARCVALCEFGPLREARRRLHREFREVMPFVPLWSPDLHLVIRKNVETTPVAERIDPLAPLRDVVQWRLGR